MIFRFLLTFYFLFQTFASLFSQDLSGAWKGYATQEKGMRSYYPFQMNLLNGKNNLWKGGSYFCFDDDTNTFVTYSIEIFKQGNQFKYKELEILKQFHKFEGMEFCIKTADITVTEDQDSLYIRGKWIGKTISGYSCEPGGLYFLSKAKNKIIPNLTELPETVKKGDSFVVNNILFEPDQSFLTKESLPELEKLTNYLKAQPRLKIEIIGHTDSGGKPEYNVVLSEKRAKAVMAYLVSKGVAQTRLTAKGLGSSKPIADNNTVEGRKKNRRTEFVILAD